MERYSLAIALGLVGVLHLLLLRRLQRPTCSRESITRITALATVGPMVIALAFWIGVLATRSPLDTADLITIYNSQIPEDVRSRIFDAQIRIWGASESASYLVVCTALAGVAMAHTLRRLITTRATGATSDAH